MKIPESVFRFCGLIFSLITFSVMAATSSQQEGAGSTFKVKYADFHAYNYLIGLNVISFVHSAWQLAVLGQSGEYDSTFTSHNRILFTYIVDQVLAFLLFSASTAAATAAQLSHHGVRSIWPPACSTWNLALFCVKADVAVVLGFLSSFVVMSSFLISAYNLSKRPDIDILGVGSG